MTEDKFWGLIEASRKGTTACEDQAEKLEKLLAELPAADIQAFDNWFDLKRNSAYRRDLWAVAYIVNGGCSDDGFEYFRSWLIGQGKENFERSLADLETIGNIASTDEENECEALAYAAADAYRTVTGEDLVPPANRTFPTLTGKEWTEEDLPDLFPRLCRKFDFG